jgi:protein-arginine kinase activator protein McsA
MNETETMMCERCNEEAAVKLVERGNVGECVCASCLADEREYHIETMQDEMALGCWDGPDFGEE